MLTCADYLEYLEHDLHTATIMVYVEGVSDGRRFLEVAGRINREKPLLVLKGGRTEAGRAAATSHTGAMAEEATIFRAATSMY